MDSGAAGSSMRVCSFATGVSPGSPAEPQSGLPSPNAASGGARNGNSNCAESFPLAERRRRREDGGEGRKGHLASLAWVDNIAGVSIESTCKFTNPYDSCSRNSG